MTRLRDFHGIHHGEAIVVCGLGKSINDLGDPQRFRTIGVNDIGRAFTPDYLFCMDGVASFSPERLRHIQESKAPYIFADHDLGIERNNVVRFSTRYSPTLRFDDPDTLYLIGRPPTSPFAAALLAAHMGAKAIGLIGVDFTSGHFWANDGIHRLTKSLQGINERFYMLGASLGERGVKFFNLSAESKLTAFPRLTPDEFDELQRSERPRSWTRPVKRVFLFSDSQVNANTASVARFINTHTTHSCRLLAPESPDLELGSAPKIERDLEEQATVRYRCSQTEFPIPLSSGEDFLAAWNSRLRPLLLGEGTPSLGFGRTRALTLSVVLSQESATGEELAEAAVALLVDLQSGDELIMLGQPSSTPSSPMGGVRCLPLLDSESYMAARNRAVAEASGDVVVFCDANVHTPRRWAEPLLDAFRNDLTAAVGPAIADMYRPHIKGFGMKLTDAELNTAWLQRHRDEPHAVPLLSGLFLAVRRDVFERLGGFDTGMRRGGADDIELCIRLWTSGFECVVAPSLEILWMNPFAAGALRHEHYWTDLLHNLVRLAGVHFGENRFEKFVEAVAHYPEFEQVYSAALDQDLEIRRQFVEQNRQYSDDWFFERFA